MKQYTSIDTVLLTQLNESLGCSSVGGGALGPPFSFPILDVLNCEFVNQLIYGSMKIERAADYRRWPSKLYYSEAL